MIIILLSKLYFVYLFLLEQFGYNNLTIFNVNMIIYIVDWIMEKWKDGCKSD